MRGKADPRRADVDGPSVIAFVRARPPGRLLRLCTSWTARWRSSEHGVPRRTLRRTILRRTPIRTAASIGLFAQQIAGMAQIAGLALTIEMWLRPGELDTNAAYPYVLAAFGR